MDRSTLPDDTSIEAVRVQAGALRKLGIEGRARMTFELSETVRAMAEAGIRHRHPEYDEQQVRSALLRVMLGEELFRRYYAGQCP